MNGFIFFEGGVRPSGRHPESAIYPYPQQGMEERTVGRGDRFRAWGELLATSIVQTRQTNPSQFSAGTFQRLTAGQ